MLLFFWAGEAAFFIEPFFRVIKAIAFYYSFTLQPSLVCLFTIRSLSGIPKRGDETIQFRDGSINVRSHPKAFEPGITPAEIGGLTDCITENGDICTLPFHLAASGGLDGYFISRITKVA